MVADMFDKDAQVDHPDLSHHARGLSSALLAATAIETLKKENSSQLTLTRGIADAASMGCLTSIIFHNTYADGHLPDSSTSGGESTTPKPHPKRQWVAGKDYFLQSLLICAGRRHARGLEDSGCQSPRSSSRQRATSFAHWDEIMENPAETRRASKKRGRTSKPTVVDFQNALRPMITFYAIIDQLSMEFSTLLEDEQIEASAERLSNLIRDCQRCKSIHELLRMANVTMDHDEIIGLLQRGMVVAY
jgi:hypothetical protein